MTELSISAAARDSPNQPAIVTADRTLTFAECEQLALNSDPSEPIAPLGCREVVADPAIDTVITIYRALQFATPLALLHPRLADDELLRQRTALRSTQVPADTAFVLFTSGSTSRARGVILTRRAIVAAAAASADRLQWRDDDRWLVCLPMAHAGGLSIVVRCLIARKPIVLHDAPFDAARVHALATSQRATLASLVPVQLIDLITFYPGTLRAVLLGGSAAPAGLVEAALAAGWPILPTYGMTEAFGQVATATELGGLPRVLPGIAITAGETLRIHGPMLATGYLDGAPIAPEFATSDVGSIEDGLVRVVGRRDDIIITGGEKVHPATVEAVLVATPGVRAACAFAVGDARWGHVVGAALVVDVTFARAAALARWHAALPPHARPRQLALAAALPTLPSGKVDRRAAAALPAASVDYSDAEIDR